MTTYCRSGFGFGYRNCDNGGLSYGARAGIGVGIAVFVLALCILAGFLARKQRRRRFAAHQASVNQSQMAYGGAQPGAYGYGGPNAPPQGGYEMGYTQPSLYSQGAATGGATYAPLTSPPPVNDGSRAEEGQAGYYAPPVGAPPPAYQPERK